ncbi:uncharacterized protein Dvar_01840 [Desulfosarcina variabilis str. Montpellier]
MDFGSRFLFCLLLTAGGKKQTETNDQQGKPREKTHLIIQAQKMVFLTGPTFKKCIWIQDQGEWAFPTADAPKEVPLGCILQYVEDWNRTFNADIEFKGAF